ncbi:DUF998 domain-containing protein [Streptococcaceae bacterium ESL0729]|nr:DUF998 domain-containing protein [Streptococcaceae bacterium ESL0729]
MLEKSIKLPEDLKADLGLKTNDRLTMSVDGSRLIVEKENSIEKNQSISLRWFLLPSILVSLVFFAYFKFYEQVEYIPFTSGDTTAISHMTIVLGLLTGIISFTTFFIKGKRSQQKNLKNIYWRSLPVLLASFAVMLVLGLMGLFWIFGIVFEGAKFDIYTSTFLFLIFISIINYLMIYFAITITPRRIISLFTLVIVGGVFLSMIANSNLQWWQINFSFLGTSNATSAWQFNLTLILSAFLLLALTDYIFSILKEILPKNRRLQILRLLLTITAFGLAGVGFFPNDKGNSYLHYMHDKSANLLIYMIIIMIIAIRWLLPDVKKEFLVISYGIGVLLVVANILFSNVRYLSLTAFEIIAFFLAFAWILLLFQNLQSLSSLNIKDYELIVE